MFGFEFQTASNAQTFLKEATNKKNIKEWEIRQREKMERKIQRKKSSSLSPQRAHKDPAVGRSGEAHQHFEKKHSGARGSWEWRRW